MLLHSEVPNAIAPIGQIGWMLQVACGPLGVRVTPAPESLHGSPSVDAESEPVRASELCCRECLETQETWVYQGNSCIKDRIGE